ncbi:MAG: hypothetical protein WC007_03305 [Pelobacteraceae bacterium]
MISFSAVRYIILSSLVALLPSVFPAIADARLTAEASINYTDYSVSDDQKNHLSAHSLTQDYSLLYSAQGSLYNSRIGKYNVSLGYNWSALDTQVNSTSGNDDVKTSRGHLFYGGEIVVDPKEVPLRLTAYSRDLNRNTFTTSESGSTYDFFSKNNGRLLGGANLATGINDGLHIDSGATLIAGVKNGMTNGYNEVLRHFPMIMLDYNDQLNRDLRSQTPIDTRLTRLAFVSLNKKDNWFHYRYVTFNDFINPTNDYQETQIQLGTIDQTLARRWIDFSNWLQVSTDIQYTKRNNTYMQQHYEEIDLNLFLQARRSNWEARSYTNFNRFREDNGTLTHSTSLPLYVSGTLNPNISWATRAAYRESHDNNGAHLESLFAGYRVDVFKHSSFTLSQHFDVESSVAESSDMHVLSGGLETASTARFSRLLSLAASYNIKNSTQAVSSRNSDFLEQILSLNASYNPSNSVRIMLRQDNELTNGANLSFSSSVRDSSTSLPQYSAPRAGAVNMSDPGSHSYRSLTTLMTSWSPLARLNVGFTAMEDLYYADNSGSSKITTISTSVEYSNSKLKFSDSLNYINGSYQLGQNTTTFSNIAALDYNHSRNLNSRVSIAYNRWTDASTVTYSTDAEQKLTYTHYSYSGMSRKLLEVDEMITYSNSPYLSPSHFSSTYNSITGDNSISSSSNGVTNNPRADRGSLSLGFKYYPLRQLVFASGARYQFENSLNNYSLLWYSSIGGNFRLFQASLDYYQGKRQSDGLLEKKFTANVKKQF